MVAPLSIRKRTVLAVHPPVDPEMAVERLADAELAADRTDLPFAARLGDDAVAERQEIVLSVKATNAAAKISTQPANILRPWPIGSRRTSKALTTRTRKPIR